MGESDTTPRTLEAHLVEPTAHKEQRLGNTLVTYWQALEDAFTSDADTQQKTNAIVTKYDLTSYAKDALKQYVPDLLDDDTFGASELAGNHPVRFTDRGFKIDHSAERKHEFCWRVPQAGRGNGFWVPIQINPDQADHWHELYTGKVDVGEFHVQRTRNGWTLRVSIYPDIDDLDFPSEPTPVGFDVGESQLLVGCALQNGNTPTEPLFIDGKNAKQLRKEMYTTLKRLQERNAEWRIDERFTYYENRLTDIVEQASREAVDYARQHDDPVIVLEDITYIRESLDYGKFMNRRLHAWAFRRLQDRIEDKAEDAGIPVRYVHAHYTSQTCHACQHLGYRPEQAEFRCQNEACWVSEYQADLNAAANIAGRLDPWGESLPVKSVGDDSPQDGSPRDRATVQAERPRQDQATNGMGTSIPARGGGDDNVASSRGGADTAGTTQMTLAHWRLETSPSN